MGIEGPVDPARVLDGCVGPKAPRPVHDRHDVESVEPHLELRAERPRDPHDYPTRLLLSDLLYALDGRLGYLLLAAHARFLSLGYSFQSSAAPPALPRPLHRGPRGGSGLLRPGHRTPASGVFASTLSRCYVHRRAPLTSVAVTSPVLVRHGANKRPDLPLGFGGSSGSRKTGLTGLPTPTAPRRAGAPDGRPLDAGRTPDGRRLASAPLTGSPLRRRLSRRDHGTRPNPRSRARMGPRLNHPNLLNLFSR